MYLLLNVNDIELDEDFDLTETPDVPELVKYPDYYMKKEADLTVDFRWKEYLLDTISNCGSELHELLSTPSRDKDTLISDIKKLFESFSALFDVSPSIAKYGGRNGRCGREYLNDYLIDICI
jgi:hypothetical protein